MEKERQQLRAGPGATIQRAHTHGGSDSADASIHSAPGIADAPVLLDHPASRGRGNAPVRAAALQRLQQTYGNRAVQRYLTQAGGAAPAHAGRETQALVQRDEGDGTSAGSSTATLDTAQTNAPAVPTEEWVIPLDRAPKALPGEQVLFNDVFKHADPALFQLVFTSAGGKFDSATGSASKTVAGLNSGNLPFFIDAAWNGRTAVTVKLEVQKVADSSVVRTYSWTFSKKTNIPTTISQQETEGERALPSDYSYKVGPDIGAAGGPDYEHVTILETFGANTSNVTMADLKPAFKTANPAITTDAQLTAHFFGGSGANGTFVVDNTDKIYDRHGGMTPKAVFEAALTTMKEIYVDLPQTYSAKAGTALGNYTIRRILKTDGTTKLKKWKT